MPTTPFSAEHDALRDSVRRLVDEVLTPMAVDAEQGATPHTDALQRCSALGLLDVDDVLAGVVVAQELGRLRSMGLVAVILAAMVAESAGISSVDGPVAVARGSRLTVTAGQADGELRYLVGGLIATRCLLTDLEQVVQAGDGWNATPVVQPHALRGAAVANVVLTSAPAIPCSVPPAARHHAQLRQAAAAVSGAWATWEQARDYAAQRHVFGRPVASFQVNRHALVECATWLTAGDALVSDAAWAAAQGDVSLVADARRYAGRVAVDIGDVAVQLHGGYGYTTAFDAQRAWRDARALVADQASPSAAPAQGAPQ